MTDNTRQSLNKDLESRYKTDKAGGAYDAKAAGTLFADGFQNTFADGFTKGGLNTKLPKKDSIYLQGLDTRKYR